VCYQAGKQSGMRFTQAQQTTTTSKQAGKQASQRASKQAAKQATKVSQCLNQSLSQSINQMGFLLRNVNEKPFTASPCHN
jgi:hypothetical protein